MGLRDKMKNRVKGMVNRLSGEHSDAAPDEVSPYAVPGVANEEAEVVMAKLNRPPPKRKKSS